MVQVNYAAFDLGTKCGVAWYTHEVGHTLLDNSNKGRFAPDAFTSFRGKVGDLIRYKNIGKVFIEKAHAGQFFHATRILFGLMGVLEEACQAYGVPYTYYSPLTIKKYWTGTGRASKADMLLQTKKLYAEVTDHNVSDALALLNYGMSQEIA